MSCPSSPEPKGQLTRNFVGNIKEKSRSNVALIFLLEIQDGHNGGYLEHNGGYLEHNGGYLKHNGGYLEHIFCPLSPEPKGQMTRNLMGSFIVTCKQKVTKIVPTGNPGWPLWWLP